MPRLKKIQELISLFYSERKVLTWLFEGISECNENDETFRALISQDKTRLKRLIESEILVKEGVKIRINQLVLNWVNQLLRKSDSLEIGQIEANYGELIRLVKYYHFLEASEQKIAHLSQIKSSIYSLKDSLQIAVEQLEDWLVLSQKDWHNQALFKAKVEDGKAVLEKLLALIHEQKQWMGNEPFFNSIEETELIRAFIRFYDALPTWENHLEQLKEELHLLISGDKEASTFFNKLTLLKKLSEKGQLAHQTNVENLLNENTPTILNPLALQIDNPNPSELTTKDIQALYQRFKSNAKKGSVEPTEFEGELSVEKENEIDLEKIKTAFSKSKLDLFSFLKEYPRLSELSFEERANLFFKMLNLYESEWKIENKWLEEEGRKFVFVWKK